MDVALPLIAIAAASLGLALGIEPIPSWYFLLLWWPYVFAVDALGRRVARHAPLRERPGALLRLSLLSVAWWTLFEAVNLRLGNWYYVMVDPDRSIRWLFGFAAFATVLPGVLATLRLLEGLSPFRSVRVAPLSWTPGRQVALLALGVFCLLSPLVWPESFFPLTWVSFVLLLVPWNRRFASRSFLRDLEEGEAGPLCRTLLAGLLCGLVWEAGNHWARQKWIYTVPGFEELKLFEMPLLGFLGFPPFAVECVLFLRFVDSLPRATAGWSALARKATATAAAVLAAFGTLLVFWVSEPITTDSHYVPLAQMELLTAEERQAFSGAGVRSPQQLLRVLDGPEASRILGVELSAERLREMRDTMGLVEHRGLGARRARQLRTLGVHRAADLRSWSPAELAAALRSRFGADAGPFLDRRARIWIDAAREAPPPP
jgi:hypothetical protein